VVGFAENQTGTGVRGISGHIKAGKFQAGVVGESNTSDGVFGVTHVSGSAGIHGLNDQGGLAGLFEGGVRCNGDVNVTGKLTGGSDANIAGKLTVDVDIILSAAAADCAEEFDIGAATGVEPGTVMVLDNDGALQPSSEAYDRRVAGVISGAGEYRPGIILDRRESSPTRHPLALLGKVFCKVDAQYGPIGVGDMLTTSPTRGHAMRASDRSLAFGAVIGKALRPLHSGQQLVPILIALQ
jgi:hypothetical protein